MSAPEIYLRMPDPKIIRVDGWMPRMPDKDILRSMESIRLIGRRLGIENALTGSVRVDGNRFEMNLHLVRLPSAQLRKTFHFAGNIKDMPAALSQTSMQVYSSLGVELSKRSQEYLSRRTPDKSDDLERFVRVLA